MYILLFFFSSRRRHTRCALVTGVQTCALPICKATANWDQYYNYTYATAAPTIYANNAFLPDVIRDRMADEGIASFRLGRIHSESMIRAENKKEMWRVATGFTATPGDWTIDGYYTHGENEIRITNFDVLHNRRFYAAIDAVEDPVTGDIVCRSTLAGYDAGCVPFNPFGAGSPSAGALDYITGDEWRNLSLRQDVAALTVQRPLFALWSDPITVAAGVEYRSESARQTTSANTAEIVDYTGVRGGPAGLAGRVGPFIVGNPQPLAGSFDIKEGFVEKIGRAHV